MVEKLGKIDAKKSLGQHFLNNPRIPALMAEAGGVTKGDIVLEIGPGTGVLTRELLNCGATVIAIEADTRAIESLEKPFSAEITAKQLRIYHADVRETDIDTFIPKGSPYKVVANIPYYLSGRLFRIFLETERQPTDLVFLVQKEVAERIARDKKESLLSLSVKVFGVPTYIKTVARGNFSPAPRVDSAIIAIHGISRNNFNDIPEKLFFELIHLGFASRRKQLIGALTKIASRDTLSRIFLECEIPEKARGEDVPLEKWLVLTKNLSRL